MYGDRISIGYHETVVIDSLGLLGKAPIPNQGSS